AQLSREEVAWFITLLLRSGQLDDVYRDIAGNIPDNANRLFVAVAVGDYRRADEYLAEMQAAQVKQRTREMLDFFRSQATPAVTVPVRLTGIGQVAEMTRRWADLVVVRGVLDLEAGLNREAARRFQEAFGVTNSPKSAASVSALLA